MWRSTEFYVNNVKQNKKPSGIKNIGCSQSVWFYPVAKSIGVAFFYTLSN